LSTSPSAVFISPTDDESDAVGAFLAERIYEFNVQATRLR